MPSTLVPLLSLAPPALALGDQLTLGDPSDTSGEIWNVITRAASLVQDGQRLENLAWRHWSQPRRSSSSESLHTPTSEQSLSFSRRSFGGSLKLLVEESSFKDWVKAAKTPSTPSATLSIRLVEPTPVPSRVGSLGASMTPGGLLTTVDKPPPLLEEDEDPPRKGKFFVQSSPSKGSGSDSSHPSPAPPRKSSHSKKPRVSLSTMKGKFHAEKRRIAEELAAKEEDGGWEDDDEGTQDEAWSDEESPIWQRKASNRETPPPPAPTPLRKMSKRQRAAAAAERAKIEAELEAQHKRQMFAKQQIFGHPGSSGLLSGMFKSGGSMVDLTAIRPAPSASAPRPLPSLLRSKSAVAVPVPTGVSITVSNLHSNSSQEKHVEMETSDESDEEDNTLNREQTDRKLANIAAKRSQPVHVDGEDQAKLKRREIIMREMSESLRKNVVLERAKSSGAPLRRPEQPRPNILGHGFLRPLTRVAEGSQLLRAQSSANLSNPSESLPMARSSTEEQARSKYPDNGYRSHGW